MAATTNESKISIIVTVDKQKNKVVFAEADHSFVDVLFSFMTLPLASIARQLNKQSDEKSSELVFKSLNNLYQSLVILPDHFFFNEECKYITLNPKSSAYHLSRKLKVNIDDTEPKKYFTCQSLDCVKYNVKFSNYCKASCHKCGKTMNQQVPFKEEDNKHVEEGVFVSDVTTYIVTDDLRVMPFTPGCCIQLLRDFGVTNASDIEEITVDLGYQQILDLLRVSFSCDSPLTYLVLKPSRGLPNSYHGTFDLCTSDEKTEHEIFLHVSLQKSTGKFLFAEAEEDFVDFISGFLAISTTTNMTKETPIRNLFL